MQSELANASRLTTMGQFAASIAHEVNQPLAAIVTNAETCFRWLANDRPDLDEVRQAAERIVGNGHRAAAILRGIRSLARISGPEMTRFNINAMIAEILTLTRGELHGHDVLRDRAISRSRIDQGRPRTVAAGHPEFDQERHRGNERGYAPAARVAG
jgi:C4-dicarboxylate-specific signal transduction histidine kinase